MSEEPQFPKWVSNTGYAIGLVFLAGLVGLALVLLGKVIL